MNDDALSADEQAAFDAEMAVVEALADKAMAPYAPLLSPVGRARLRESVVEALATHPAVSRLVMRALGRA